MHGKRILYVDDDEAMLRIVSATLPRLCGVEVVTAATGSHALALLGKTRFDLVLLDYELPDLEGADPLRRDPDPPRGRHAGGLPVRPRGRAAAARRAWPGANAFLPKPSPPAAIAAGIAPLLREQRHRRGPPMNERIDPYVAYRLQLLQEARRCAPSGSASARASPRPAIA